MMSPWIVISEFRPEVDFNYFTFPNVSFDTRSLDSDDSPGTVSIV
jgi:hypothetical protein